jgi:ribosome-associated translation inhibitor RaiA
MVTIVTCRVSGAKARANRLALAASKRLVRFFRRIVLVEWVFEEESGNTVARGRVHSRSGFYRAVGRGTDMNEALTQVLHRLEKQRRRKKSMRVTRRRRTSIERTNR